MRLVNTFTLLSILALLTQAKWSSESSSEEQGLWNIHRQLNNHFGSLSHNGLFQHGERTVIQVILDCKFIIAWFAEHNISTTHGQSRSEDEICLHRQYL
ncbi:hypothetical protein PRIPAC_83944 [Pristionchus pacificus]|uniref:Uncharacterized protein n=1 Tax=Pristionchus pacificus TaxID=54126 RepID=A0A2A6BTM4_PRIPA|nr:hypothetical protein PRIPAC_83944 [Pristionchus pacificus]|eukprot:PDM69279.1 hypothetical protein PRIPAC_47581 [Pristionchus pacificus]